MKAEDLYTWRPMHTAHGLTIWAYGNQHRRYVAIRRDVDGQRLNREIPRVRCGADRRYRCTVRFRTW
jgi:hypothetical protein